MIEIKELTKRFDKTIAVNNLTIELGDGVTGLVGENGAGKSTLFRLIAGVYQPDNGTIAIDGFDAQSKEAKASLFFLSDEPFFNLGDTPISLYKTYSTFFDLDKEKYLELISKFELPANKTLQTYSKGMKRKAFIALSLAMNVRYLLMDEAFDGLDPIVLESIKEVIIEKTKSGTAVVISTHNIALLDKLADQFIVLSRGILASTSESNDKAEKMIKIQLLFDKEYSQKDFENIGLDIVAYEKVGSTIHIVLEDTSDIAEKIDKLGKPILFERIPLQREETIKLMMLSAKEEK